MKRKTLKNFGCFAKKMSVAFLAAVFFFVQFAVLTSFLSWDGFKDLSFSSSHQVVESGAFAETRITSDGNIVERFFTGLKEMPFMDYLVLSNAQGEASYIPLRAETSFLEISGMMFYETLGNAKDLLFAFSAGSFAFVLAMALLVYVVFQGWAFFKNDAGFLMYRALAKNRASGGHSRIESGTGSELVEGSLCIYKKSG